MKDIKIVLPSEGISTRLAVLGKELGRELSEERYEILVAELRKEDMARITA